MTATWGQSDLVCTLTGMDLMGLPLRAPNATYDRVYTLPLLTIKMGKGTGECYEMIVYEMIVLITTKYLYYQTYIYQLLMDTLSTFLQGIVTSVPSDAPDDYAALCDMQVCVCFFCFSFFFLGHTTYI